MNTGLNNLFRAPVNNTGLDPLQGFDVQVWVTDVYSGKIMDIGSFQSCTLSIRNATETYLELGQRVPIYLDGEIQIAWVLERGKLATDFLFSWFGTNEISREMYMSRGPRFQISIDMNAAELNNPNPGDIRVDSRWGSSNFFTPTDNPNQFAFDSPIKRNAKGRLELLRCKLDSMSEGIMPGRRVIANRWEGVAEGVRFVNDTAQQFKTTRNRESGSPFQSVQGGGAQGARLTE